MTGDRAADLLLYALMLVLPLSALIARRIPIMNVLKTAFAWIAIFGVGLVLVGQRDRIAPILADARDTLVGTEQSVVGETVRIRMAGDGHFWADVTLNGVKRRMLIDSGATVTAISGRTARAVALDTDADLRPVILRTANGQVAAKRARIERMTLGSIEAWDLPVVVSDAFGDVDVIGMNFLSRLGSWRVTGNTLILDPKQTGI